MKTKVIVNPNSAKGEIGRRWREIEEKLSRAIGRPRALLYMSKIYKGRHIGMKDVTSLRGRKLVATTSEEVLLDVDGEAPGRLPATFEVLPGAIKLGC